jgi:hypothetical protein
LGKIPSRLPAELEDLISTYSDAAAVAVRQACIQVFERLKEHAVAEWLAEQQRQMGRPPAKDHKIVLERKYRPPVTNGVAEAKTDADWGFVANAVRNALRLIDEDGPYTVMQIGDYIRRTPSTIGVTDMQIRGTIKSLIRQKEVVRAERGRFSPGPNLKSPQSRQNTFF